MNLHLMSQKAGRLLHGTVWLVLPYSLALTCKKLLECGLIIVVLLLVGSLWSWEVDSVG